MQVSEKDHGALKVNSGSWLICPFEFKRVSELCESSRLMSFAGHLSSLVPPSTKVRLPPLLATLMMMTP